MAVRPYCFESMAAQGAVFFYLTTGMEKEFTWNQIKFSTPSLFLPLETGKVTAPAGG
jgi:hypothetical protein